MLGKVVAESQKDWDDRLPYVLAAYHASPHRSTGFTPNRLFVGHENRMPIDLVMGLPASERPDGMNLDDFVERQQKLATEAFDLAREHLHTNAERRKVAYDIRVKKTEFAVGDWVWYYNPRKFINRSHKWQRCYTGPFLIVRAVPPVNFVLQKSPKMKPFVVHSDKIKRCYSDTPPNWLKNHEESSTKNSDHLSKEQQELGTVDDGNHFNRFRDSSQQPTSSRVRKSRMPEVSGDIDTDDIQGQTMPVLELSQRPRRMIKSPRRLLDFVCQYQR